MTLSFVILSLALTLFDKNFDGIVKYNSSKVTLTKNYVHTQCDAESINGYKLTVENTFPCSQCTCLREMGIGNLRSDRDCFLPTTLTTLKGG